MRNLDLEFCGLGHSEEHQKKKFVEWLQGQSSVEEQQKTLAKIA
jgi:hypothetical protein